MSTLTIEMSDVLRNYDLLYAALDELKLSDTLVVHKSYWGWSDKIRTRVHTHAKRTRKKFRIRPESPRLGKASGILILRIV